MYRLLVLLMLPMTACYNAEDLIEPLLLDPSFELRQIELPLESDTGSFHYYNHPDRLDYDASFVSGFDELPLSGQLDSTPWTGSYWPKNKGGIGYRWQSNESHDYRLLAPDEIAAAPREVIAGLSPAEKYDLYVGAGDWPLATSAFAGNSASEPDWSGYCHGWAPASMTYAQPQPIEVVGATGVTIPFGSADIKALLTFFEGEVSATDYYAASSGPWARDRLAAGGNCNSGAPSDPNCFDVNP